ncbi:hypothetical protein [Chlamydiifrater phoenicopteri]|uniref:hypothetical protein n=1 Tax=Chlamydiifrater phoenicopteri TaxID=2681469 RepID=UPI001BCC8D33|nr:hypothetical protein [Chlamydiifrater phoenicopteri]
MKNKKTTSTLKQTITTAEGATPPDYGTGVLQQNLFLHNSTLNLQKNLSTEHSFLGRNMNVTGETNVQCPLKIGNDLSSKNASLKETNISDNIEVSLSENQKCKFENIQHPKARYDAMTWGYLRTRAVESLNCFSRGWKHLPDGKLNTIPFLMNAGTDKNYSPSAWKYFSLKEYKLHLLKVGIYQVSINVARSAGRHNGNDEQDLRMNLCMGSNVTHLSYTDSRGLGRNDPTIRTLYGVFSVLSIDEKNPENVWIEFTIYGEMYLESVSLSAIWFPLGLDFTEKD